MSGNRSRTSSRTEVRVVPMRCTNFAKRYDFAAFQVGKVKKSNIKINFVIGCCIYCKEV